MMDGLLLIGVDGGATEAKAHAATGDVQADETPHSRAGFGYALRAESAGRVYERLAGFAAAPVAEQIAQRDGGRIELSAVERQQGSIWVAAAADAVRDVARACGASRVLVGIGMPGLKTSDGRGINVINNGPRIPDYLEQLESRLSEGGLVLAAPISAIGSDADYCGLGEEYASDGLFRDVENAYYCGGGTGIADALKLRGRLVPLDQTKSWLMKSWQIGSAVGPTFEKLVSAASLNRIYSDLKGGRPEVAFPEQAARAGDAVALSWMHAAACVLAELLFERLHAVFAGRPNAPFRGEAYGKLATTHEFRGVVLDRVIIGQRIGAIYGDPAYREIFAARVDACLARLIADSGNDGLIRGCLARDGSLRAGLVVASKLRAAPALGAAVAAARAFGSRG